MPFPTKFEKFLNDYYRKKDRCAYLEPVTLEPVELTPHFLRLAVLAFAHHTKPRWNNIWFVTHVFSSNGRRAKIHHMHALKSVAWMHIIFLVLKNFKNVQGIRTAGHLYRRSTNLENHYMLQHKYGPIGT